MLNDNMPIRSRTRERVINGVKYKVTSRFSEQARETVEQKLLRYISDRVFEELKKPIKPAV